MTRFLLAAGLAAAFVSSVPAQVPIVQVYLDGELETIHRECPPTATLDTLYVVASGFITPIIDIEYRIDTFGNFGILQDFFPTGFTNEGFSGDGIRVSFGSSKDASGKLLVQRIWGAWFCASCGGSAAYIIVQPHPISGKVQGTGWPDLTKIEATGGFNNLCVVLPVESSTWGRIKALYR